MKLSKILSLPNVRIILFLAEKGEARYSQLSKIVQSRGALTAAFRELDTEKLVTRRIEQTRPIQSYYSLTKLGREVGVELTRLNRLLPKSD